MKYMLMICDDEKAWAKISDAERQQMYAEYGQLSQELKASGTIDGDSQPVVIIVSPKPKRSMWPMGMF